MASRDVVHRPCGPVQCTARRNRHSRICVVPALVLMTTLCWFATGLVSVVAATATFKGKGPAATPTPAPGATATATAPTTGSVISDGDEASVVAEADVDLFPVPSMTKGSLRSWPLPHPAPHVVFVSVGLRGHATPLLRLAREMVVRGYRVSFVSNTHAGAWVAATGSQFVSAGPLPMDDGELEVLLRKVTSDPSTFQGVSALLGQLYLPAGAALFDTLDTFVAAHAPQLIVADAAAAGARDVGHRYGVAVVVNNPTLLPLKDDVPRYLPAWGTGFSADMSLTARAMNLLFPRLLSVALTPAFMQFNKLRWAQGLDAARSQHELFTGVRVLRNSAVGFDLPRPRSPDVAMVGPILPARMRTKSLPTSLRRFLDPALAAGTGYDHQPSAAAAAAHGGVQETSASAHGNENGNGNGNGNGSGNTHTNGATLEQDMPRTIGVYLRLGAMTFPDSAMVRALTHALSAPNMRVLWSLPSFQSSLAPATLPPTFKVRSSESMPNFKVLASPAVHVVVSHCGLGAAQEALYFGKPLLCIPFFADQPDVAARVIDAGVGTAVDKTTMDAADIRSRVVDLFSNATITQRARRVGRLLRRAGGVHRAADVLEAELRLGSQHLHTMENVMPWHRRMMIDVFAVYLAAIMLVAAVRSTNARTPNRVPQ